MPINQLGGGRVPGFSLIAISRGKKHPGGIQHTAEING